MLIPTKETPIAKDLFDNQETVPLEQNGDVYLKGFNVPPGQSPLAYGQKFYQDHKNTTDEEIRDYLDDENKPDKQNFLYKFQGSENGLICWFKEFEEVDECQTKEELNTTIAENKIFLERLKDLWAYQTFNSDIRFATEDYFHLQTFMRVQQLFFAQLISIAEDGRSDEAIDLWLQNSAMLNNLMNGRYTLLSKAVFAITTTHSNDSILKISKFTDLTDNQFAKIKDALSKPAFGPDGWDIKKTGQAEYNYILNTFRLAYPKENIFEKLDSLFLNPNFGKNELAAFYKDLIDLSELPPVEFKKRHDEIEDIYNDKFSIKGFGIVKLLAHAPIEKLMLGGVFKGQELIKNRLHFSIRNRMIILAMLIRMNNYDDQGISLMLHSQPAELQNPITKQAFEWDGEYIIFDGLNEPSNTYGVKVY